MYCKHCGQQIDDDALVCPHCGKQVAEVKVQEAPQTQPQVQTQNTQVAAKTLDVGDGLITVTKVFYLISMITLAICTLGIALSWCLPMKRRLYPALEKKEEVSVALKVCTLIFVSTVSGVVLLAGYHD